MRHGKKFNHLGRTSSHRKAMLANMASSLIEHKRIKTTLAKGKELRKYVEPLITRSKNDTTHNRRVVFGYLQNKDAIKELFGGISQKIADRPGGYTRILKTGSRLGDGAEMCIIELVDYNEDMMNAPDQAGNKKRTRRGRKKDVDSSASKETKTEQTSNVTATENVVKETTVETTPAETVADATETVTTTTTTTTETVIEDGVEVSETTETVVDNVTEEATEKGGGLMDGLKDMKDNVVEKAGDLKDNIVDKASDLKDDAADLIADNADDVVDPDA